MAEAFRPWPQSRRWLRLLTDFDAIDAIDQSDPIDEELWAALK